MPSCDLKPTHSDLSLLDLSLLLVFIGLYVDWVIENQACHLVFIVKTGPYH